MELKVKLKAQALEGGRREGSRCARAREREREGGRPAGDEREKEVEVSQQSPLLSKD